MEKRTKNRQFSVENSEVEYLHEQLSQLKSDLAFYKDKLNQWNEIIEEGLFIHEDFIITEVNHAFSKITGYTMDEMVGMHGKHLLTDESYEKLQNHVSLKTDNPLELQIRTKNGDIKHVHSKGKLFKAGGMKKRVVIVQDISTLKKTHASLNESEQKYKSLIENLEIGIGISKDEKILFANPALLSIYGLKSFEELASKKITDYIPAPSKKAVKERIRKYKRDEEQNNIFRHDIIRSDGEIRTLELTSSELIFEGEKCRQVLMKDISKELETENALKQASNIFNNIQLGLLIYRLDDLKDDKSLRMVAVNPASTKLVGLSADEMIGKSLDDIFPNLRKKKIPQQYAEVVRSQIPIAFDDIYYEDERVSASFFSVKVFPLPDQCVGISFKNVSERRKSELDLRDKNQELNNFVYKVSHDLRAPLNSIKGLINLSKIEDTDYTPKIEERIDYLDGFIRDILSHSRNLNVAIIIEKVELAKMTKDWFSELEHIENSQQIKRSIKITGLDFYSDKIRLSEIIRNLVSNAIKYHDGSKKNMYINVTGKVTKEKASITFEDNGIGIRDEFVDDIFNMFYRATDKAEGTGIGLYIVKQAVEKLNGKIHVESRHGAGSTFKLELPNLVSKKES